MGARGWRGHICRLAPGGRGGGSWAGLLCLLCGWWAAVTVPVVRASLLFPLPVAVTHRRAAQRFQEGQLRSALTLLQQAVVRAPSEAGGAANETALAHSLLELAVVWRALGRLERATNATEEALALLESDWSRGGPDAEASRRLWLRGRTQLGAQLLDGGDTNRSVTILRDAASREGASFVTFLSLADALWVAGEVGESLEWQRRALWASVASGGSPTSLRDAANAESGERRSNAVPPDAALPAVFRLGESLRILAHFGAAQPLLEAARQLASELPESRDRTWTVSRIERSLRALEASRRGLLRTRAVLGERPMTDAMYRATDGHGADRASARFEDASAAMDAGRFEAALEAMDDVLQLDAETLGTAHPSFATSLVAHAAACLSAGRPAEALEDLVEARSLWHDLLGPPSQAARHSLPYVRSWLLTGVALHQTGEVLQAWRALDRAQTLARATLERTHPLAATATMYATLVRVEIDERLLARRCRAEDGAAFCRAWVERATARRLLPVVRQAVRRFRRVEDHALNVEFQSLARLEALLFFRANAARSLTVLEAAMLDLAVENTNRWSLSGRSLFFVAVENVVVAKTRTGDIEGAIRYAEHAFGLAMRRAQGGGSGPGQPPGHPDHDLGPGGQAMAAAAALVAASGSSRTSPSSSSSSSSSPFAAFASSASGAAGGAGFNASALSATVFEFLLGEGGWSRVQHAGNATKATGTKKLAASAADPSAPAPGASPVAQAPPPPSPPPPPSAMSRARLDGRWRKLRSLFPSLREHWTHHLSPGAPAPPGSSTASGASRKPHCFQARLADATNLFSLLQTHVEAWRAHMERLGVPVPSLVTGEAAVLNVPGGVAGAPARGPGPILTPH